MTEHSLAVLHGHEEIFKAVGHRHQGWQLHNSGRTVHRVQRVNQGIADLQRAGIGLEQQQSVVDRLNFLLQFQAEQLKRRGFG